MYIYICVCMCVCVYTLYNGNIQSAQYIEQFIHLYYGMGKIKLIYIYIYIYTDDLYLQESRILRKL